MTCLHNSPEEKKWGYEWARESPNICLVWTVIFTSVFLFLPPKNTHTHTEPEASTQFKMRLLQPILLIITTTNCFSWEVGRVITRALNQYFIYPFWVNFYHLKLFCITTALLSFVLICRVAHALVIGLEMFKIFVFMSFETLITRRAVGHIGARQRKYIKFNNANTVEFEKPWSVLIKILEMNL